MPVAMLAIVIFLFIASIPLIQKTLAINKEVAELAQSVKALEDKRDQLKNMNKSKLSNSATIASLALPEKPSPLLVMARIREAAASAGVIIKRIGVQIEENSEEQSVAKKVEATEGENAVKIEVEGPVVNVANFLNDAARSLPVVRIGAGRMSVTSGIVTASVTVNTYWQNLPTKLGNIDSLLPQLTSEENQLLTQINQFRQVVSVGTVVETSGESGRLNPFSF